MSINLIDDWRAVLRKAWSIKFSVAAAALGGLEVAVALIQPEGIPNGVFAGMAGLTTTAAVVARIMAQREISDGK
jgi:hypothetical protein